jgi:hypothetical protein
MVVITPNSFRIRRYGKRHGLHTGLSRHMTFHCAGIMPTFPWRFDALRLIIMRFFGATHLDDAS